MRPNPQPSKKKLGHLEDIRKQLGLSQRKMAQLLLVDPSAWTRWTRSGERAPPHIYRALQWYLALEEKYPALDVGFWLNSQREIASSSVNPEQIEDLQQKMVELRSAHCAQMSELMAQQTNVQNLRQRLEEEISQMSHRDPVSAISQNIREKTWLLLIIGILAGLCTGAIFTRILL